MAGPTEAALSAMFTTHRVLNRAPQLAWGVVRDGQLSMHGGDDADERTVFRIASMTKSFTAAAVLHLRDAGVLRLDDSIAHYAPELASVRYPTSDAPAITVRDLLTMSAGLPTEDPWADRHMDITDDELDALIAAGFTFAVPTGTAMQYSNLGYALLGRVVWRATGVRVQDHVRRCFLKPLGMDSTGWTLQDLSTDVTMARGFAIAEDPDCDWVEVAQCGDGAIAPMGGIYTTIEDLAKWVTFVLDAFPARDGCDAAPLSRATRREMQQGWRMFAPETRTALDGATRVVQGGYGMGLMAQHHDTLGPVVTHSGGIPGYGSNMRWVPGTGVGVVALANVTYARMADATAAVLDLLQQHEVVGRVVTPNAPHLGDAARSLISLLGSWNDTAADVLFADNMFADRSRAARSEEAGELVARHHELTVERIDAMNGTEADVVVRGRDQTFTVSLSLTPHARPLVLWYEINE